MRFPKWWIWIAALSLLLSAGGAGGQTWDMSLATGPRPSPLPLFYEEGVRFHQKLVGLPDGGLHLVFLDLFVPAEYEPLMIQRRYRNGLDREGIFGRGWVSNLDVRLLQRPDDAVQIIEADGLLTRYTADALGRYAAVAGSFLKHSLTRAGDGKFVREWADGTKEVFDKRGRLESRSKDKDKIAFHYSDDSSARPARISDGMGRTLTLTYRNSLLAQAVDPLGRKIRYKHDEGRLSEVTDPIDRTSRYAYADGRLAEMTLPRGQQISFKYTSDGSLNLISGPGELETSFVWQRGTDRPGIELTTVLGNGTREVLSISPTLPEKGTASLTEIALRRGAGLRLQRKDGAGVVSSALLLSDQVVFQEGGASGAFALDPAGGLDRLDAARSGDGGLRENGLFALGVDGPDWQSRFTPAMAPLSDPQIRYDAVGRPIEFLLGENRREVWKWDDADRVVEWVDPAGVTTRYRYDAHNNITEILENGQRSASFEYDKRDLLVKAVRRGDGETSFTYDKAGNPIVIKDERGQTARLAYDQANRLVELVSPASERARIEYDGQGRAAKIAGPEGGVDSYAYDERGRLIAERDERGRETSYTYDAEERLASVRYPQGEIEQFSYDGDSIRVNVAFPDGTEGSEEYDSFGRLRKMRLAGGAELSADYDERGLLTAVTDSANGATRFRYDSLGRLIEESTTEGDSRKYAYVPSPSALQRRTATFLNWLLVGSLAVAIPALVLGLLSYFRRLRWRRYLYAAAASLALFAAASLLRPYTRGYPPSAQGELLAIEDGNIKTLFRYLKDGGWIAVTERGDLKVEIEYDAAGRITREQDQDGGTTRYRYSAAGDLIKVESPSGTLEYEYDSSGRVQKVTSSQGDKKASLQYAYNASGDLAGVTHEDGTSERFVYDNARRLIEEVDRIGNSYRYRYDDLDRIRAIAGPHGEHTFQYDNGGRLIAETDPVEGSYRYEYSGRAGELTVIDPAGFRTRLRLDPYGQPLVMTDALGGEITHAYDPAGRLAAYTDPNGHRTLWRRDARGNIIERRMPSGKLYRYSYDGDGNLTEAKLPNGGSLGFDYDASSRLAAIRHGESKQWSYRYNKSSQPESISGPYGDSRYRYDALGRMTGYKDPFDRETVLAYDAPGRLASIRAPEGETFTYRYNRRGLIEAIESDKGKTGFFYDDKGRLERIEYPNRTRVRYQYEAGWRLASVHAQGGDGGIIYKEEYAYDTRGNLITVTDSEGTSRFRYDALSRLVEAAHPDGRTERFVYDAAGNLLSAPGAATAQYNEDQELVQWGGRKLEYDGAGNLLRIEAGAAFRWDAAGQLVEASLPEGRKIAFAYDAEGRRIETKSPSETTRYLYAGPYLLAEYDEGGKRKALYLPGLDPDNWIALRRDGKEYYPIRSHLGSVMAVVDESGRVVKRFRYDSYGHAVKVEGDLPIQPHFAGRPLDAPTGLIHFGARYYSPELKRFISSDPIGPDKDGNRYGYALSNPLRFTDLTGTAGKSLKGLRGKPLPPMDPDRYDAAKNAQALSRYFGRSNVRTVEPGVVLIRTAKSKHTPHGIQLWVDPAIPKERASDIWDRYMKQESRRPNPKNPTLHVDHLYPQARAQQNRYKFVRFVLTEGGPNTSGGAGNEKVRLRLPAEGYRPSGEKIPGHRGIPDLHRVDAWSRTKLENVRPGPKSRGYPGVQRAGLRGGAKIVGVATAVGIGYALLTGDAEAIKPAALLDLGLLTAQSLPPGAVSQAMSAISSRSQAAYVAARELSARALSRVPGAANTLLQASGRGFHALRVGARIAGAIGGRALGLAARVLPVAGPLLLVKDAVDLGKWLGETAADVYIGLLKRKDAFLKAISGILDDVEEDEETKERRKRRVEELWERMPSQGEPMLVGSLLGRRPAGTTALARAGASESRASPTTTPSRPTEPRAPTEPGRSPDAEAPEEAGGAGTVATPGATAAGGGTTAGTTTPSGTVPGREGAAPVAPEPGRTADTSPSTPETAARSAARRIPEETKRGLWDRIKDALRPGAKDATSLPGTQPGARPGVETASRPPAPTGPTTPSRPAQPGTTPSSRTAPAGPSDPGRGAPPPGLPPTPTAPGQPATTPPGVSKRPSPEAVRVAVLRGLIKRADDEIRTSRDPAQKRKVENIRRGLVKELGEQETSLRKKGEAVPGEPSTPQRPPSLDDLIPPVAPPEPQPGEPTEVAKAPDPGSPTQPTPDFEGLPLPENLKPPRRPTETKTPAPEPPPPPSQPSQPGGTAKPGAGEKTTATPERRTAPPPSPEPSPPVEEPKKGLLDRIIDGLSSLFGGGSSDGQGSGQPPPRPERPTIPPAEQPKPEPKRGLFGTIIDKLSNLFGD